MKTLVLPLLTMFLPSFRVLTASAQTTYYAHSGTLTSYNVVTGYFDNSGSFVSPSGMGAGCYYGQCPAWQFSNYPLSYVLPDGTTASFHNFSGTANFTNQFDMKVQGTASGTDDKGLFVNVTVSWDWSAFCHAGRGGGCTKKFLGGQLTIQ